MVTAPRRFGADSRMVLMAGVAGACLLGASAGAWVRPEAADLKSRALAQTPQRPAAPMAAPPQMQIVMDEDLVLPHRPPMEVLPDWAVRPPPAPPVVIPAREDRPVRLVRVEAKRAPIKAKADKPPPARPAKAEPAAVTQARAEISKPAKAKRVEIAKATAKTPKPAKVKSGKAALAKLDKAKPAAKAPKPKSETAALAKADPKPRTKAAAPARLAEAKPPAPPKLEAPTKLAKPPPKATAKAQPQLVRSAPNPWAAEDRRLERAYRRAADAGVPEWRLARQQARWRQARDAAAREAPWEVPQVYDARIAELDDLAGEAAMEWE